MIARRSEFAILAIGITAFVVLSIEHDRAHRGTPPSTYSTYDTGPNGYRALYAVLLGAGVPVRRFGHALGTLDSAGLQTLVVSNYDNEPSARPLGVRDRDALARFVRGGGRLVVLDTGFAGSEDIVPAVGVSKPVRAYGAIALARNRYTAGVRSVAAVIDAAFPFAMRSGQPLLANRSGIVAALYSYGKGDVVAITAPNLFSNASLRDADNAAFAYDVVAGHGPAAFDEYVHGYDEDLGFWEVLPAPARAAFWIVVAIVVLALIGANVPFAPPFAPPDADTRDSAAYVTAMAALLRRSRGAGMLVARFADDAVRRARGRNDPQLRHAIEELQRLRNAPPSDAALVRAAAIAYQLRKEYG